MNRETGHSEPCGAPPAEQRHLSTWTTREKIGRVLWYWIEATLFRLSPRPMYRWRAWLVRRFGGEVHPTARLRSTVRIEVPWHLSVGAGSSVGDFAILYCLGPIRIGRGVTISQYAHLCAGTHDFTRRDMPLLRPPIVVEDEAWIAADAFVGPNVTIGEGCVVGARSSVFADLPPWSVCAGSPAKAVKPRPRFDPK
ncbi:MAG: hypothetical protein KJZ69_07685 [Phycisphaerales bacterium]|nr:hypothetical protein [Phycisphaerales bacterium]